MISIATLFKEHKNNIYTISRLSTYELKIAHISKRLGIVWVFLNPLTQIFVYWLVFGLGIRGGAPVHGVPFFVWLICGMIPWFYMGAAISQGSNSIYARIATVSKMNFPLSIVPTISIITQLYTHLVLLMALVVIVIVSHGWSISIIGLAYFVFSLTCFLIALALVTSTLSTIVRDIHLVVQTASRLLFFLTPVMWTVNDKTPATLREIIELNPLFYVIEGYRSSLLDGDLSLIRSTDTLIFWGITLLLFFVGSIIHVRFRKMFVDYL